MAATLDSTSPGLQETARVEARPGRPRVVGDPGSINRWTNLG